MDQWAEGSVHVGNVRNRAALLDDVGLGAAHVEGAPARRLRQHEAEAVDVRLERDLASAHAELFGGHVIVFTGESAADDRSFAQAQGARDAEVDDLRLAHVAVRQDDIVWRYIAMDDPLPMRRLKGMPDPPLQDSDVGERERS